MGIFKYNMLFLERYKQFKKDVQLGIGSVKLAWLLLEALEQKRNLMSEGSYVRRIDVMLKRQEIQFTSNFPLDESEEPIAFQYANLSDISNKGAVFLVIKEDWVNQAFREDQRDENLNVLYDWLKATLEVVDWLREEGEIILTASEIREWCQR